MISHVSNSLQAALSRLNPTAQVSKASVALPAAASASAKVMFGSQSSEIAEIYSISPQKRVTTPAGMNSTQIQNLMHSVMTSGPSIGFNGLGSALLAQLQDNPGDLTQVLTAAQVGESAVSAGQDSAVALTITTQTGVTVSLSLTRQSDGMAVEIKTSGTLSKDESEAIAGLGEAFQKALNGLAQQQPKMDLSGLTTFDSSILKSVDLKTDIRSGDTKLQSLNFRADDAERWVAYQDQDVSLKMTSDRSQSTIGGNAAQQLLTLSAYDKQFDKARSDGHGDKAQMDMLKSVFRALNASSPSQQSEATTAASTAIRLGSTAASRLSGLNDFSLELTQTEKSINPYRQDEKQSFSYQASQTTENNRLFDGSGSIKQTNHAHLSASWYKPVDASIPLSLNMMKSSQNYYYHQLEQDSVNTTSLNFNTQGQLASVGSTSQISNRETVTKYVLGEVIESLTTPEDDNKENLIKLLEDN
ncbi:MAG TPA: hypothetical protein VJS14_16145 [Enterobacteriaceae bacterium]|nr:hypothetical protein [Enterobacteriaceae bacterium]